MGKQISLGALQAKFLAAPMALEAAVRLELKVVGSKVRDDATKKFGTYQPAVGDLPPWAMLSPVTVAQKERAMKGATARVSSRRDARIAAGGSNDEPLIGAYPGKSKNTVWGKPLFGTIESHVESAGIWQNMAVYIGTRDPLGKYHEFGTSGPHAVPPRPFLRPAAFENQEYFLRRMALAWEAAIRSW